MFHQNFIPWKSKSPVTFWITGVLCDCSQKKTLPFGDVFFRGCPDGLEPSTFRTTSTDADSLGVPLYCAKVR